MGVKRGCKRTNWETEKNQKEKETQNKNRIKNWNRYKILLYGHINRIDLAKSESGRQGVGERERERGADGEREADR